MTSVLPYPASEVRLTIDKQGARQYTKMSYPVHCGRYSELTTRDWILHFNLNNEVVRAKGRGRDWPHPNEWLKRTVGNDWIYYSSGGYTGVFEATGEYYLPNLPYTTNGLLGGDPYADEIVGRLTRDWPLIIDNLLATVSGLPGESRAFLLKAAANSPQVLADKANQLFAISGHRATVLPPDARHVDYNVIPLTIATGCLYKCRFCEVKNKRPFAPVPQESVSAQITKLAELYDRDLVNYNALFLAEHDGLQAGQAPILAALDEAYRRFGFAGSYLKGCSAFLFGSVTSLLNAPDSFFSELERRPYNVYINIGLESADQATLDLLGKPVTEALVKETFNRIQAINDRFSKTEITANFVLDDELPEAHLTSFLALVRDGLDRVKPKGCVYLSPLRFGQPSRAKTFGFNRLKVLSRVPTFLYIIQRL